MTPYSAEPLSEYGAPWTEGSSTEVHRHIVEEMQATIDALTARVTDLEEQLEHSYDDGTYTPDAPIP